MSPHSTAESGLPTPLTQFVGRERELAEVRELLDSSRLFTVTGAGGSGKTRLALEVAAQMPGEVVWIDLSPVGAPALVSGHAAASMGVPQEAGIPADEAISTALRDRRVLMVLDNCEHVVDAASRLAEVLLLRSPGLRILATSREALGVTGEVAWLLPRLSLPSADAADAEQIAASEAVELFLARARDGLPSFVLDEANAPSVARICRHLDGLPLAIELAAARVRVLTPDQIAERLGDRFRLLTSGSRTAVPRHRTLRAAMDWSYGLLSDSEQLLLQRLSVFAGGFTLEAVEAICPDERVATWEVLDLLSRLVERSLVDLRERLANARYGLLETVQQYAAEKMEETGEGDALEQRHAAYFLEFAEATAPRLFLGGTGSEWLERVDAEMANLRAAGDWLLSDDRADQALRLAAALQWYFYRRDLAEGRRWLERALEKPGASSVARARALEGLGAIRHWQGDGRTMLEPLAEAVSILRDHGDQETLATALAWTGLGMIEAGDAEGATAAVAEAIDLARGVGGAAMVHVGSIAAHVARVRGDLARAQELLEESQRRARELGLTRQLKLLAVTSGRVLYEQGDLAGSAEHHREHLSQGDRPEYGWATPIAIESLAVVAAAQGEVLRTARLLGAAEAFRHRVGTTLRPFEEADRSVFEGVRRELGRNAFDMAFAEGRALAAESAVEYALGEGEEIPDAGAVAAPDARPAAATHPDIPTGPTPPVTAALAVRALGSLEISLSGEPVEAEAWSHARPRQLLLYLLCHPEGRTRGQIGLDFWPEASSAQVKNSFHVLLHKLRRILGSSDFVVLDADRYRIEPKLEVWFDATVFETEVTAALRLLRAGEKPARRLDDALALYRGDLLEEEAGAGDWLLDLSDRLRRLHADALSALAGLRMEEGDFEAAAALLERLVRQENLREEAYRRLMDCLSHTGRRDEALRHYARLVTLLRHELDAEPEPETRELAERLRKPAGP